MDDEVACREKKGHHVCLEVMKDCLDCECDDADVRMRDGLFYDLPGYGPAY